MPFRCCVQFYSRLSTLDHDFRGKTTEQLPIALSLLGLRGYAESSWGRERRASSPAAAVASPEHTNLWRTPNWHTDPDKANRTSNTLFSRRISDVKLDSRQEATGIAAFTSVSTIPTGKGWQQGEANGKYRHLSIFQLNRTPGVSERFFNVSYV